MGMKNLVKILSTELQNQIIKIVEKKGYNGKKLVEKDTLNSEKD